MIYKGRIYRRLKVGELATACDLMQAIEYSKTTEGLVPRYYGAVIDTNRTAVLNDYRLVYAGRKNLAKKDTTV